MLALELFKRLLKHGEKKRRKTTPEKIKNKKIKNKK